MKLSGVILPHVTPLTADVSDTYADVFPQIAQTLRSTVKTGNTLVSREQKLNAFLTDMTAFSNTTKAFLDYFGLKSLDELPKALGSFAKQGGAAVWDFHVSEKVVSPTIRRAHPPGKHKQA